MGRERRYLLMWEGRRVTYTRLVFVKQLMMGMSQWDSWHKLDTFSVLGSS